jgi:hypothetical protein
MKRKEAGAPIAVGVNLRTSPRVLVLCKPRETTRSLIVFPRNRSSMGLFTFWSASYKYPNQDSRSMQLHDLFHGFSPNKPCQVT